MKPVAAVLALALLGSQAHAEQCHAVDGDSLRCEASGRVRLHGIYAAEAGEPGGPEATQRLRSMVDGRDVTIVPRGRDRYGRLLGDVYVGGQRIGQQHIGGPPGGRGIKR